MKLTAISQVALGLLLHWEHGRRSADGATDAAAGH